MNSSLGSVVPLAMFMKSAVPNQTCRYQEKCKISDQDCWSIGLVDLALPVKLLTSSPSSFACPYRSASTTNAIIVMIAVSPHDTFESSASPQLSCQKSEENSINFQHWPLLDRVEWRLLGGGHFFRGFGDFVIMGSSSEKLIELRLYAKEGMKQQLKLSQVFSSCQLCQSIDVANNALSVTKQHRNNFRPTRIWCHNFDWINQF